MSTNLEYRERERQRKRESRATGQRSSTRKGAKETFSVGGTIWNFVAAGCSRSQVHQGENERQWKKSEKEHDIPSTKRVTRKFLEVSRNSRAKQRQRNVQKKVCCTCKVAFLLIRPIVVVFFFYRCRCLRRSCSINDFTFCSSTDYKNYWELRF